MRKIKFRAFDRKCQKMRKISTIGLNGKGVDSMLTFSHDKDGCTQAMLNNYSDLMQFTGLKDKNRKEIYEGDIMQHDNPFDIPFVVNWIDADCGFGFNDGTTSYVIADPSLTVIGNIHENPELLNK